MLTPSSIVRVGLLTIAVAVPVTASAALDPGRIPLVIAVSGSSFGLESWPLTPGRHPKPTPIAGIGGLTGYGAASDGRRVVVANGNSVVIFDLQTKHKTVVPDPYGTALDVAIDKKGALYVDNLSGTSGNVVIYAPGKKARELSCPILEYPEWIAVDNEGDVFLMDYSDVVEIPKGRDGPDATHCRALQLKPGVSGYSAGIAVDPKTDDLLVLDDPDECAGGIEGRLTTYRKPYEGSVGHSRVVGQSCSGTVRLDANSRIVLTGDETVDGSYSFILAHTYPEGSFVGSFGGGSPFGFTTVPSTLPN